jgi:hypothetical protein
MQLTLHRIAIAVIAVNIIVAAVVRAEDTKPRPTYQAVRASAPPVIDGDLSDAAWSSAPEITGFTQRDPSEGQPATQQTKVRIVYDDEAIYFGALMEDNGKATPLLARRDSDLNNGDYIRISIDSQHDRANGAGFVVNASNVQMDMTLYNDIYDDPSWDAVWQSATKITPQGWVAEVRIPYSQLRFPDRPVHTWGFNVSRWNARLRESSRLVFTPKSESVFISKFADLTGIEGIKPKRALEVMPYGVARQDLHSKFDNPFIPSSSQAMDAGVDVKYSLTSSLRLTGTINPDFGQVEVDPAVINLSQFETFFPEKRPFFTEGQNIFNFGNGPADSRWGFNMSFPTFFYSRRIGRAPQGFVNPQYIDGLRETGTSVDFVDTPGQTTILGAAKVTGKIGKGWTVGTLDAVTDKEQAWFRGGSVVGQQTVEPMTNYFVGRATKEVGSDARVGVMFTSVNRKLTDNLEPSLRNSAYFGGVDGYKFFKKKSWLLEWLGGTSLVSGSESAIAATQRSSARYYQRPDAGHVEFDPTRTSLNGWMGRAMFAKQNGKLRPNFQVQMLSPGFEVNDVGFLPRVDAVATHAVLQYYNPDVTKKTREISWWIAKYQNFNFDGDNTANGVSSNFYFQFLNYRYMWISSGARTGAIDDQRTRGGPALRSAGNRFVNVGFGNDSRKKFYAETWFERDDTTDGGSENYIGTYLVYRPSPALRFVLSPTFSDTTSMTQYVTTLRDPDYSATYGNRYIFAAIDQRSLDIGIRTEWTVSSRLSAQLYLQPFIASGHYRDYKQLTRPRDDEYTPADGSAFNPDFNFRSVRGSAVVRWEFRPGSALYVVWNENRSDVAPIGDFRFRRDLSALPNAPSEDVFLVKFSYWLPI